MVCAGDFRKGTKFLYEGVPHIVIDYQHTKPAKQGGGAIIRTKMRNMESGVIYERTFRTEEKFEIPDLQQRTMQYLYKDGEEYHFMDQKNYDQVVLTVKQLEDVKDYLKENAAYAMLYFDDRAIEVTPSIFIDLQVIETQPGVRGDTAQGGATKPATLETGMVLQVPLFVVEGDLIKVDTRTGQYVERVKK